MMDRSVLSRQMFAAGGPVYMQEGGDPQMAQLQAQADAMGITLRELLAIMKEYHPEISSYLYHPR